MELRNMSPRKRLRCLRNAAWSRTKSRWYCRNAQVAQFLEEQFPDSRVGLQRRTRRGQRKVRLSVERLAQRCPRERVHACISELLYERANSNITLKTFFCKKKDGIEHGSSESNNCRGFSCGSCEGSSAKFLLGYRKCHEVVVDKNGPTMVAFKRIPPNENTRPEASRDIEKTTPATHLDTCNLIRLYKNIDFDR